MSSAPALLEVTDQCTSRHETKASYEVRDQLEVAGGGTGGIK